MREAMELTGKKFGRLLVLEKCNNYHKKGKFSPMYDFTDEVIELIEGFYDIDVPKIYNILKRTGCIGCPYAQKNLINDLSLATKNQVKFAIDSFGESYKVKGYYEQIMQILDEKEDQI